MKRALVHTVWLLTLWTAPGLAQPHQRESEAERPPAAQQTAPATKQHQQVIRRPYQQRETWYEFLLKQFNQENFDYGAWIEHRRQAFLEARASNPHFWYSFLATAALALLLVMHTKLWIDNRRSLWSAAEFLADVVNHDRYSRHVAREAIERYNRHIETCNRVIEAAESGKPMPTSIELEDTRRELERLRTELDTKISENLRLQAEVEKQHATTADLSLRVQGLERQLRGRNGEQSSAGSVPVTGLNVDLVNRINRLEQDLSAERKKNRRLKGG